jgi:hypothetical protein
MSELARLVTARYQEVNGSHPMTAADDRYVNQHFVTLEELCVGRDQTPDGIRTHMLAGRLPLPSYLRSDGTEMVPPDLLELADRAGGISRLPEWFQSMWADREKAAQEWDSYLSGRYVCLRSVRPDTIIRKDQLTSRIRAALAEPRPDSVAWLAWLHILVDDLESVELPFTGYDRLRFCGPTSRDTLIDAVRSQFPLGGSGVASESSARCRPRAERTRQTCL